MKKKSIMILVGMLLTFAAIALLFSFTHKWSETVFEAIVQETIAMSDSETHLIVKRTTEIYGNPLNSLCISEETKLMDKDGKTITLEEVYEGSVVRVSLKNSFVEETPFYYPIVYEIRKIDANRL